MHLRHGVSWGVFSRCSDGNPEYGYWCGAFRDDPCVEAFKKDARKKTFFLAPCGMAPVAGHLAEAIPASQAGTYENDAASPEFLLQRAWEMP